MLFATFKDITRFEQTLFGLPFILAGACLSILKTPISIKWIWMISAFLLARISGMAFNQLIDREIDSKNPRTQNRPIPAGRVTVTQARLVAWGGLILFLIVCFQINLLTALLSLVAAFLIYIYSFMKRIHYFCHFVLGLIHFLGPIMAYSALTGTISVSVIFLGAAACFLIAGADIMYSIQDYVFDCRNRLFSIPVHLGIEKSSLMAASIHFVSLLMLLGVGLSAHFPIFYYLVIFIAGGAFSYFHFAFFKRKKVVEALFFFCNVSVSVSSLLFIAASVLWRVLL